MRGARSALQPVVGDRFRDWADAYKEGHDLIQVRLLYRREGGEEWQEAPMVSIGHDRWQGELVVSENARYQYTVEAFTDVFGSWAADLEKRVAADQDVASELLEGKRL